MIILCQKKIYFYEFPIIPIVTSFEVQIVHCVTFRSDKLLICDRKFSVLLVTRLKYGHSLSD